MENARNLIAVAVTYCLFQTALLLSLAARNAQEFTVWYWWVIIFAQLLSIPGWGAVVFRLTYGHSHIVKRSLAVLTIGAIGVPISATAGLLFVSSFPALFLDPDRRAPNLLLAVGAAITLAAIGWFVKKSHRWARNREIALFLEEKLFGLSSSNRKSRLRALRVATILPVALVSIIYVFFLPLWGLVTHMRRITPPGYAITVPHAWIVADHLDYGNGNFHLWGVTPCDSLPHLSPRRCLGTWGLNTAEFGQTSNDFWRPKEVEIIAEQSYSLGDQSVRCFVVSYSRNGWPSYECSGRSRLRTSYSGPPSGLADFHTMMQNAVHMP